MPAILPHLRHASLPARTCMHNVVIPWFRSLVFYRPQASITARISSHVHLDVTALYLIRNNISQTHMHSCTQPIFPSPPALDT